MTKGDAEQKQSDAVENDTDWVAHAKKWLSE